MIYHIETSVGNYIKDHYTSAVEVGFGGKTVAAKILLEAGIPVLCTDVHTYNTDVPAVVDDCVETALGLGACAFYKMDDGYYFHRLALRMSESKEPTCAYASVSSLRYTVFTLPILARVVS